MKNRYLWTVVAASIISIFLVWSPFLLKVNNFLGVDFAKAGMERIVQNFDGLNFIVVAKTWYKPVLIEQNFTEILNGRKASYFAAHYPGFPTLIGLFDAVGLSGTQALLASVLTSNILLALSAYYFFNIFLGNKQKLAVTAAIIALFVPGRMLGVRAVGANETLFIALVLASLAASLKNKHWLAGAAGALAFLTRSPGILLFPAYILYFAIYNGKNWKKTLTDSIPYLLIPAAMLGLFIFYGIRFGSVWAYFQVGGNINLYYPFAVFASHQDWVSGFWLEDLVYLFAILGLSGAYIWKKLSDKSLALTPVWTFAGIYLLFLTAVAHRDLARYSLPLWPLAIGALNPVWNNKPAKIVLLILSIPVLLFTWQFVLANYQPISNWQPFL